MSRLIEQFTASGHRGLEQSVQHVRDQRSVDALRPSLPIILSLVAGTAAFAQPARADAISWVGYQAGPPHIYRSSASWFHGDQWFNYLVPGAQDIAIFDSRFDPQANGMPSTVYFGDYLVGAQAPTIPNAFTVPGGDAAVDRLSVREGSFEFRFTDSRGNPQGSLTANRIEVGARNRSTSELNLRSGAASSGYVSVSGSQTGVSRLSMEGAELHMPSNSLVDVGVLGGRGELFVGPDALLKTGYVRVGENAGSNGLMHVTGQNARAEVHGMQIGASSTGRLEVRSGATLTSNGTIFLANYSNGSASGTAIIAGTDSRMTSTAGGIVVGDSGTGVLTVVDGGAVETGYVFVGGRGINESAFRIADPDSSARVSGGVYLESSRADARVTVEDGGNLHARLAQVRVAPNATASSPESSVRIRSGGLATFDTSVLLDKQDGDAILDVGTSGRVQIGTVTAPAAGGEIRIGAGGSLAGNGTVIGDVFVESGGMISPGLSPGLLDITGSMALLQGSSLFMEIGGSTPDLFDQLILSGDASLAGTLTLDFINGYAPMPGTVFELLNANGTIAGHFDTVDIRGIDPSRLTIGTVDGSLYVSMVPAPSVASLIGLGALIASSRRRGAAA